MLYNIYNFAKFKTRFIALTMKRAKFLRKDFSKIMFQENSTTHIESATVNTNYSSCSANKSRPYMAILHDLWDARIIVKNLQTSFDLQDQLVQANKVEYLRVHEVAVATQGEIAVEDSFDLLDEWTTSFEFQAELGNKLFAARDRVVALQTELDEATNRGTQGVTYVQ